MWVCGNTSVGDKPCSTVCPAFPFRWISVGLLVEKFVGSSRIRYIDRVVAYLNAIGLGWVDLRLHPNCSKYFGVHSKAHSNRDNRPTAIPSTIFRGVRWWPLPRPAEGILIPSFHRDNDDDLPRQCGRHLLQERMWGAEQSTNSKMRWGVW